MLSKDSLTRELSDRICKHSQDVCCINSYNLGDARLATKEIYKFIKALYFTLYKPTDPCVKKLALKNEERKRYEATLRNGKVTMFNRTDGYGIFNPGEEMLCLPLDTFISKEVIEFVNRVFPLTKKFSFKQFKAEDLYPYFGHLVGADIIDKKLQGGMTPQIAAELSEEMHFNRLYEKGIEFTDDEAKQLFLRKTFKDVRNECFYLGVGNCGLMADAAFVEAIYQDHSYPITYLRFICKDDPKADVLNCVALGNWPDPGCMIIAPWLKKDSVFVWNGTIENTPRVTAVLSSFNSYQVLYRLAPAEKEQAKSELKKMGYTQWLESETRTRNLNKIRDNAKTFLQNIEEVIHVQKNNMNAKVYP